MAELLPFPRTVPFHELNAGDVFALSTGAGAPVYAVIHPAYQFPPTYGRRVQQPQPVIGRTEVEQYGGRTVYRNQYGPMPALTVETHEVADPSLPVILLRPCDTYSLWSYDVWGNAADGFQVNDRCCIDRNLSIPTLPTLEIGSDGRPDTVTYDPTDDELLVAVGRKPGRYEIDHGADYGDGNYEVIRNSNEMPIGQIIRNENPADVKSEAPAGWDHV